MKYLCNVVLVSALFFSPARGKGNANVLIAEHLRERLNCSSKESGLGKKNDGKLLLTEDASGITFVKGIDHAGPIKEKIFLECSQLYWAKQQELILQLENMQKISDQTAIRFLQELLIKKYEEKYTDIITRMGFEIYTERAVLEDCLTILFQNKNMINAHDYELLSFCVEHYLSVIDKLNELVNTLIIGYVYKRECKKI